MPQNSGWVVSAIGVLREGLERESVCVCVRVGGVCVGGGGYYCDPILYVVSH